MNKQAGNENLQQVYNLIFQEDDITWQSMIFEMAREGKINPWDIDLSILAQEFIETIRKFKEMNFRLSGKMILVAAILLKLKSDDLGLEQLLMLTNPEMFPAEAEDDNDLIDIEAEKHFTKANLDLRIPGIRKRKVTVFELVEALKKAIDVDDQRQKRFVEWKRANQAPPLMIKKIDIFAKIEDIYLRLKALFGKFKKNTCTFEDITPSKVKQDIVWTIIPLLHLAQQGKITLEQSSPFGEIRVNMCKGFNIPLKREEENEKGKK